MEARGLDAAQSLLSICQGGQTVVDSAIGFSDQGMSKWNSLALRDVFLHSPIVPSSTQGSSSLR